METQEITDKQAKCNKNVMEDLVHEEIVRQLRHYPKNLAGYINKVEVATYALNRLPALYASSHNGQSQQLQIARKKYKDQVVSAVRRAIAAVERDPLARCRLHREAPRLDPTTEQRRRRVRVLAGIKVHRIARVW